jgi:methionyl-tRNA formyltransferase
VDEKVDHGNIISNHKCEISNLDTYVTLEQKLAEVAGNLLIETLPNFVAKKIKPKEQNHTDATFTKKLVTQDAFVDPKLLKKAETEGSEVAEKIYNMIRALNPEPGAWTTQNGKRIKLLEGKLENNRLKLIKVQEESKKPRLLTGNMGVL